MEDREQKLSIHALILEFLKEQPQGASIRDISSGINLNRNLVAKYLSILHMQGRVDLRSYGKVKIFRVSQRIPFHALYLVTNGCVIGLDQLLYIKEVQGNCSILIGSEREKILYKPFSEIFHPALNDPMVSTFIQDYKIGTAAPKFRKDIGWRGKTYTLIIVPTIYDDGSCGLAILLSESNHINYPNHELKRNIDTYLNITKEDPGFIVHMKVDGELLYLNESYARYCGKNSKEVIHTMGIPLITQDDFFHIRDNAAMTPNHETTPPLDISVVMDDGSIRWQEWVFYPIREYGVLRQIHGYGRDITNEREIKNHYQRLETDFQQIVHQKISELRDMTAKLKREIDDRKSLERALKKSEEKYRNLTEITTDIIWEADQNGNLIYVNPQVINILGYPPDQVIGKQLWDLIRSEHSETIKEIFSASEVNPFEQLIFPIINQDNSLVWLELSGIPLFDEEKQFSGFRGVGRNVTKFVASEEYNKRLLAIIENTPDIVRISDMDGNLLYINKAGRKCLKVPDDADITKFNSSHFMEIEDWKKILDGRSNAIRTGIWQGITKLKAEDGTIIPVSQVIIAHKTGKNNELIFSTVARDISDITKASQKLENANVYTRTLIEVNLDPLVTIGSDGKIQDVNQATENATGYSRQELIGTDFCSYFSNKEHAREGYEKVFSEGFVRDYPLEIVHKNGHKTPVLYNASVYKNKDEIIQGVFASARDISAMKQSEQKLADSRDYYLKILDEIPNPIWRAGPDAKCDYFNKSWLSFTGRSLEDEKEDGWVTGVHPDDVERCVNEYLTSFEKHEPFFMVYRLRHHDGTYHRIADYGSPISDLKEEFCGYIGSCYDLESQEIV